MVQPTRKKLDEDIETGAGIFEEIRGGRILSNGCVYEECLSLAGDVAYFAHE